MLPTILAVTTPWARSLVPGGEMDRVDRKCVSGKEKGVGWVFKKGKRGKQ